ncbi:T9SS type A sorting domain-containing protein [Aquimarina sp. AU474]|uniref:T9SS type A sorting domain-containing protein n=1 Tax=Aquimarina sp. AU474 TaxID=2108529 RepID=UPI000D687855|nr:T9SS type A sorting domain-containing protein [Aquimarina sp. AU474]
MNVEEVMRNQLQSKNKWSPVIFSFLLMMVTYGQSFAVGDIRYEIISSTEVMVVDYTGTASSVNIPEKVVNNGAEYTLTHIGTSAFQKGELVESVIIPNSVRSIGSNAFGCNQLEQVTIPQKMEGIKIRSFLDHPDHTTVVVEPGSPLIFEVRTRTFKDNWFGDDYRGEMDLIAPLNDRILYKNYDSRVSFKSVTVNVVRPLNETNKSCDFTVYPNPAQDKIHIRLCDGEELQEVNIYNTLGVQLYSSRILQIDVSDLYSGMYILEIETKTGAKVVKRIIINKA